MDRNSYRRLQFIILHEHNNYTVDWETTFQLTLKMTSAQVAGTDLAGRCTGYAHTSPPPLPDDAAFFFVFAFKFVNFTNQSRHTLVVPWPWVIETSVTEAVLSRTTHIRTIQHPYVYINSFKPKSRPIKKLLQLIRGFPTHTAQLFLTWALLPPNRSTL